MISFRERACGASWTRSLRSLPTVRRTHLAGRSLSAACAAFLKSSDKAQQQWELERRLRTNLKPAF